jgi:ABC-type oligopeptide transport system ATPase subunit
MASFWGVGWGASLRLIQHRRARSRFISHDFNVVDYLSDRAMVMDLGKIVAVASAEELYRKPLYPYTQALLSANPALRAGESSQTRIVSQGENPRPLEGPCGIAPDHVEDSDVFRAP